MVLKTYSLYNPEKDVTEDFNEALFLKILQLAYHRDRKLYQHLKKKYQDMEQKVVTDYQILDYKV